MPTPVVAVVIGVLVGTLLALVAIVVVLVRRLSRMLREVRELEHRIRPVLAQLQNGAEVTSAELERVGQALSRSGQPRNG